MVQLFLVAAPCAWLAALLAIVAWRHAPEVLVPFVQSIPILPAYATTLLWMGPLLVFLGVMLLVWELLKLRPWAMAFDNVVITTGILMWFAACALQPADSWWRPFAVPVGSVLLFAPLCFTLVLMMLKTTEDDLGQTLLVFFAFVAAVAGVHWWVLGW